MRSTVTRWIARLVALIRPRRTDAAMTREMRAHLDLMADDLERQGLSPEAARTAALRAFGGLEQVKERHRDARSFVAIEQLLQDLRHAARGLRKSPGFAIAAVLSIMLALVRARPDVESAALSTPGVLTGGSMTLDVEVRDSPGQPRTVGNVHVVFATPGYLETLRMPLLRGRDFAQTDSAGAPPVSLVNEELARQMWPGQDPIGKRFKGWTGVQLEVVGVVGNSNYQTFEDAGAPSRFRPSTRSR